MHQTAGLLSSSWLKGFLIVIALMLSSLGPLGAQEGAAPSEAASEGDLGNAAALSPALLGAAGLIEEIETAQQTRRLLIQEVEERLADPTIEEEELSQLVTRLVTLREQARGALERLDPVVRQSARALEDLGPAPEEGAAPETAVVAEERAARTAGLARVQGLVQQVEANFGDGGRLLDRIAEIRRDRFYASKFARGPLPFAPESFEAAGRGLIEGATSSLAGLTAWYRGKAQAGAATTALALLGAACALFFFLMLPVRVWSTRAFEHRFAQQEPTPNGRVLLAGLRTFKRLIPALVAGVVVLLVADAQGLIGEETRVLAARIWLGFLFLVFTEALARSVFAPRTDVWRLTHLGDAQARVVYLLFVVIAALYAADWIADAALLMWQVEPAGVALIRLLFVGAFSVCLLLITSPSLWARPEGQEEQTPSTSSAAPEERHASFWGQARVGLRIFALFLFAAGIAGYSVLAQYGFHTFVRLAALFAVFWFFRALIRASLARIPTLRTAVTDPDDAPADPDQAPATGGLFWAGLTADTVLLFALSPIVLFLLGFGWQEIQAWITNAFFGIEIGNFTLSLSDLLSALVLFLIFLSITRFVQRTLERRILPQTRMDPGVQNSLLTLIGYAGLVIAAMIGFGALGFDLSNLAIIAGALSVGIGFGLQSIVNNFVSGLILLFERPIKVGDWVETSAGEGIVKRISVRSTVIETFERAAVIVPNSELIASPVKNWVLRDKLGRVSIPIGVGYGSDTEHVRDVLLDVARSHPRVLSYPAPAVHFVDFGASSLDMLLFAFISDIGSGFSTRTELRHAIVKRFREEGIEIPFPQRDLTVRGVDSDILEQIGRQPAVPSGREGAAPTAPPTGAGASNPSNGPEARG